MSAAAASRFRSLVRGLTAFVPLTVVALLCAAPASAQVVFDSASNASPATVSAATSFVVQWNHTVGLAKKPYITVGVSIKRNGGAQTVTSVMYGTEAGGPNLAMTLLGSVNNGTVARAEIWGVAGPIPGTHQIQVTVANAGAANTVVVAGSKSFSNVFQTAASGTAVTATGTSLTPSVAVANSVFDYVVDAVAYNGNVALTPSAGQTNSYNLTSAAPVFSGAGSIKTGVANTTLSWTATGGALQWAAVAVPLQSANPQILFDAASSGTIVSNANPVVLSWNHTTTTAANRYVVVGLATRLNGGTVGTNVTVTGVTYGGTAMTFLGRQTRTTTVNVELWGLVNPASGVQAVVATVSNTGARNLVIDGGAQTFSNVDQSSPIATAAAGANANSTNPTVAVTNTPYNYVVDVVGFNTNVTLTPGAQQDQRWNTLTAAGTNFDGAGSGSRGYTNTTMSWDSAGTATNWAIEAVALRQVTVGLLKTASADVVKLGQTVTYTITATNYTAATVNAVTITDAIPAGTVFVSQTGCGGVGPVTCNIGSLAAGTTSAPITITVTTVAAGTISNVATVTYTGAATANSSETIRTLAEARICASPGKDGSPGTVSGIRNDYWPGSASVNAGATSLTVGARNGLGALLPAGITAGDLIIVMQMQDAAFDTTNDETYGEGTGSTRATGTGSGAATTLNNAGRWEYAVVASTVPAAGITAAGGTITINGGGAGGGLLYSYTSQTFATTTTQGQRTFQVIRVPQYATATLGALTAAAWNGSSGGVLAIDVSGTLALGGATVSVDGLGFRGGGGRVLTGDATAGLTFTDFRTPTTETTNGSKGEGIAGTPRFFYQSGATIGAPGVNTAGDNGAANEGYAGGSYGRGGAGNAGGGSTDGQPSSNQMNSGGGGGGNGGNGGAGGNGWSCNCAGGGQGGGSISPSLTRITMGGGGGAGTTNNGSAEVCIAPPTCRVNVPGDWADTDPSNGYYSSGANGGGVIIIRALQATGTATLTANGGTGPNTGRDGPGGGGAGGSVLFTTQTGVLTGLTIQAKGGNGGNAWLTTPAGAAPFEYHGPGGGGGGGYILLSSAAGSTDVTGGTNGVTTTANIPYGAQPGTAGVVQFMAGNNVLPGGDGATCAVTDLSVTNVDNPDPVVTGSNITYTQVVTNNGPNWADQITFSTSVPASANFQSMTPAPGWTCITPAIGATGNITCTAPGLAVGASASFTFVVQSEPGTPLGYQITNTANATSLTNETTYVNNTATATTQVTNLVNADLRVAITAPATVVANVNYAYTQTITNGGSFAASNPSFTETTPPNTTFQGMGAPPAGWTCITPAIGGTGTITCSSPNPLAAGASLSFPLTLRVNAGTPAGTVVTETANTATTSPDPYLPNNSSSANTVVVAANTADIAVTMAVAPSNVGQQDLVRFTSVVTNNGVVATNATFAAHQVPANSTFVSITPPAGWTCTPPPVGSPAGTAIPCSTTGTMAVGASATFVEVFQELAGTAAGSNITNNLTVNPIAAPAGVTDSNAANNTASATATVRAPGNADLSIVKTDSPDPVGVGQLVTYLLTVVNNGPETATGITTSDTLPASMLFVSSSPSQGSCAGTTTVTCNLGSLAVNGSATVSIVVQATVTGTIANTATVSGTKTDPVAANNSSTANTTVLAVTVIKLRSFSAAQDKDKVLISWQTDMEQDNLGFNIYRDEAGKRVKINKQLIAGSAFSSAHQLSPDTLRSYRFRDKIDNANDFVQYWLEDVDISATHTMHGPMTPVFQSGIGSPPNSDPLPGLGSGGSSLISPAGYGAPRTILLDTPTAKQIRTQLDLAADTGLKIYVSQEGWYRITRAAMIAAGYEPGTDPRSISVFTQGLEVPINIVDANNDGKLDPTDAVEFYGMPLDSVSTGARTYWLRGGKGNGSRVQTIAGAGTGTSPDVGFIWSRKDRSIFFAALTNNGEADNFFGPIISADPMTQDVLATGLDPAFTGNARLEVSIQGGTEGFQHLISVQLAGHNLGNVALNSQDWRTFSFVLPQTWLTGGANTLSLTALNGQDDVSVLTEVRLTYVHLMKADNNAFEATVASGRTYTIPGFTGNKVRVVDVTDPLNPLDLGATVAASGGGYAATFSTPPGNNRIVLAVGDERVITNPELAANRPSTWTDDKKGADFVIVTNRAFYDAVLPLQALRQQQGLSTAVVDVEDAYDEAGFGARSAKAIKDFLQNTSKWKKVPRYVMLVGDASFDARNYLGLGAFDYVPTKLVVTTGLKTASDDWFVDFDNNGYPELAIGRLPSRTADEATAMVTKIVNRAVSGDWSNKALLINEGTSGYDFVGVTNTISSLLPAAMQKQTINIAASGTAHNDIISAWNAGDLLVNFVGHGSVELWGLHNVFSSTDGAALTNTNKLPFLIAMNCLNGYFHDLYTESLAESMMKNPNGGAVAVWSSSALTQPDQQAQMNAELIRQLFGSAPTIGDAIIRAKKVVRDLDVTKSWILFGDPTMKLR